MTDDEAVITVYRYKHVEGSVSAKEANRARAHLRARWGDAKGLRPDETSAPNQLLDDARRRRALFERPDAWLDADGNVAAITSHHYHLTAEDMANVLAYASQEGWEVLVTGYGSWKSAGDAVIIEYTRRKKG